MGEEKGRVWLIMVHRRRPPEESWPCSCTVKGSAQLLALIAGSSSGPCPPSSCGRCFRKAARRVYLHSQANPSHLLGFLRHRRYYYYMARRWICILSDLITQKMLPPSVLMSVINSIWSRNYAKLAPFGAVRTFFAFSSDAPLSTCFYDYIYFQEA